MAEFVNNDPASQEFPEAKVEYGGNPEVTLKVAAESRSGDGMYARDNTLNDLQVAARPLSVATIDWQGDAIELAAFNLEDLVFGGRRKKMLNRYKLFRWDVLRIEFHGEFPPAVSAFGKVVYVPGPNTGWGDISSVYGDRYYSLNGAEIYAGPTNTSCILEIPWQYHQQWYEDRPDDRDQITFGKVFFLNYSRPMANNRLITLRLHVVTEVIGMRVAYTVPHVGSRNENIYYLPTTDFFCATTNPASLTPWTSANKRAPDSMSLRSIFNNWHYQDKLGWSSTQVKGTVLRSKNLGDFKTIDTVYDLLKMYCRAFSGTYDLRLCFAKDMFTKGELAVVISPKKLKSSDSDDYLGYPHIVLPVGNKDSYSLVLPNPRSYPVQATQDRLEWYVSYVVHTALVSSTNQPVYIFSFLRGHYENSGRGTLTFYQPRHIEVSWKNVVDTTPQNEDVVSTIMTPSGIHDVINELIYFGDISEAVKLPPGGLMPIVNMMQLLERKDVLLFKRDETTWPGIASFAPVPVHPMMAPLQVRGNKLGVVGSMYWGWRGTLEYAIVMPDPITKVVVSGGWQKFFDAEIAPATADDLRWQGVIGGSMEFAETVSANVFSLSNMCYGNFFINPPYPSNLAFAKSPAPKSVTKFPDPLFTQSIHMYSWTGAEPDKLSRYSKVYVGAGADFEYLIYRGFSKLTIARFLLEWAGNAIDLSKFGTDDFPSNWLPVNIKKEAPTEKTPLALKVGRAIDPVSTYGDRTNMTTTVTTTTAGSVRVDLPAPAPETILFRRGQNEVKQRQTD